MGGGGVLVRFRCFVASSGTSLEDQGVRARRLGFLGYSRRVLLQGLCGCSHARETMNPETPKLNRIGTLIRFKVCSFIKGNDRLWVLGFGCSACPWLLTIREPRSSYKLRALVFCQKFRVSGLGFSKYPFPTTQY